MDPHLDGYGDGPGSAYQHGDPHLGSTTGGSGDVHQYLDSRRHRAGLRYPHIPSTHTHAGTNDHTGVHQDAHAPTHSRR